MLYTFLFGPLKSFASLILYNQAYKCVNCFFERPKDIYTHKHIHADLYIHTYNTHAHISIVYVCAYGFLHRYFLLAYISASLPWYC